VEALEPPGLTGTAALAEYMRSANVVEVLSLAGGGGHGRKRAVILEGGVGVVAKYSDRTGGSQAEQMVRAEAAAWRLADELGWPHFVPTTVLRQLKDPDDPLIQVDASVQVLLPRFRTSLDGGFTANSCEVADRFRCAVFDVLCLNTDRNSGNWGKIEGRSAPTLIDHGHAFETFGGTAAGDFLQVASGQAVSDEISEDLERFILSEANSELAQLLGDERAGRVFERARQLVQSRTVTAP
jgi:hypothetical protein